jgi:hypothetical protein
VTVSTTQYSPAVTSLIVQTPVASVVQVNAVAVSSAPRLPPTGALSL